MGYILFSVFFWLVAIIISIVIFAGALLVWVITFPFDRKGWVQHRYSCFWGWFILWINPFWKLDIQGREKIDESMTCVAVANHQSMLDIPLLHSLFFHFKWVSKKENLYLPLVGWNMILNRYVIIDRASKKSTLKMMRECRNYLENGSSMMIFPEGSRSFDGKLRNFKDGAFRLALQTNLPILPIVQDGTWKAVKGNKMVINGHTTMKVRVLDPVMPHEFGDRDPGELSKKVRSVMESALNEMRQTAAR
jgi:1-acyl-sn-glycerol-3-phosphate acyltransferase